ncbi:BQ5605_C020g09089 [Microbotryum silenes-dioicae]|uniref:BQ5605_C020g09089 protein n=1 Tax=Microbotryum silenes-dioicae TaxID=796604 RepID=A0A2X0MJK1_9BASI|nr:BQ5605_C020g09089 [Microbotryum silenes-dioicae]
MTISTTTRSLLPRSPRCLPLLCTAARRTLLPSSPASPLRHPPRRSLATTSPRRSTPTSADPLPLQVTALPNGVRVATDPAPGHFVAAGIYVDAGSRYESDLTRGSGHMVDRLGFKSTSNRTYEQMAKEIEHLGGQFLSSSSRETIMYQATTYTHSLDSVVSLLSDTVLNPLITPEELDQQRDAALWEIGEIKTKPEMILPEVLHEVAFQHNTLGNPLLCPEDRLRTMATSTLKDFLKMWYKPERMVLAAAGVEHDRMLDLADKYFGHLEKGVGVGSTITPATSSSLPFVPSAASTSIPTSASTASSSLFRHLSTSATSSASLASSSASPSPLDPTGFDYLSTAPAKYTGGELYLDNPDLEFTHIYIAYEGLSIHDPDIYALATLQVLLGGGGSFSAGGPGKGMYSRLYTSVLNQHYAVDFCAAFHHCYLDSGLFGLSIAVNPTWIASAPWVLANELDAITRPTQGGIDHGDVQRARNQLKSSLMMALESRMVQVEDLGRQVQVHGKKTPMQEMVALINQVSLNDIYRVAGRVLRPKKSSIVGDRKRSGKPTIVVQGQLNGLPDIPGTLARKGLNGEA